MDRTLISVMCLVTSLTFLIANAEAAPLKFKIINKSTEALNSFRATLRGAAVDISPNRLSWPVAASATVAVQFDPGGTSCVFDLAFTTASGKVTNQPDIDLCQTDGIVFQ